MDKKSVNKTWLATEDKELIFIVFCVVWFVHGLWMYDVNSTTCGDLSVGTWAAPSGCGLQAYK